MLNSLPAQTPTRDKDSFFSSLVVGVVLVNLFAYLMVGNSLFNSRKHYDRLAEVSTQNLAKSLEANFSDILDKMNIVLYSVREEAEEQLATRGIDKSVLSGYAKRQIQVLPEIDTISITDSAGNVLCGSDGRTTSVNISDRDYFRKLSNGPDQQLVVSNLLKGKVTGSWRIIAARRYNKPDGSFAGAVIGTVDVAYLDNLLAHLDIGRYGAVGVRDADFKLVALHPKGKEAASQIGSNVISQKTRDMILANPVTATYKTVFARDNKERMVTFRKVAKYPYYIFATISPVDYMTSWRKEATVGLVLLLLFTAMTALSARYLYKSKMNAQLHAEAKRYGDEMRQQNEELNAALIRIKRLEGIISICSYCKKIRTQEDSWEQLETYFSEHSDAMFSHGICPDCAGEQQRVFQEAIASQKDDTNSP
ncbi:cache domain-containing protein [Geomonas agri]|uniref:cache domain-containing protein n=1 Tax=Geomonas agri TaxID=2873702 RepID=UPI001CD320D6|nr:cache domain-containing protein [Geomonas agri]